MSAPMTWDDLLEHCSRLHTTRTRRAYPASVFPDNDERREDSQVLYVVADGTRARVVPTRMHEPGFYVQLPGDGMWRSDHSLALFRRMVDDGRVFVADDQESRL